MAFGSGWRALVTLVRDTLKALGGSAHLVEVAKIIWRDHEADLQASGDLFYTWQYDMRWAANRYDEPES